MWNVGQERLIMSEETACSLQNSGYRCRVATNCCDIDTVALNQMIARAWKHDYRDDVRPDPGEHFLRKLTKEGEWIAAVCEDIVGQPVGFEIGVPRSLWFGHRKLRCWYVTAFSVHLTRFYRLHNLLEGDGFIANLAKDSGVYMEFARDWAGTLLSDLSELILLK